MSKYYFEKWNVREEKFEVCHYNRSTPEFVGKVIYTKSMNTLSNSYELDQNTGHFITDNGKNVFLEVGKGIHTAVVEYRAEGDTLYYTEKVLENKTITFTSYRIKSYCVPSTDTRQVRGDRYLGTVKGNMYEYPENGIYEGIWYIRRNTDNSILVIEPKEGDVVGGDLFVKWEKVPGRGKYVIEVSYDGFETYGKEYYISGDLDEFTIPQDELETSETVQLKLFKLNDDNSDFKMTGFSGVFSTVKNSPPERPTHLTPSRTISSSNNEVILQWKFNDKDMGDYQTEFEIMVQEEDSEGNKIGEPDEYYGKSKESSFTIRNNRYIGGSYSDPIYVNWKVRVADRFGRWSPWSLSEEFFLVEEVYPVEIIPPSHGIWTSTSDFFQIKWDEPDSQDNRIIVSVKDKDGNEVEFFRDVLDRRSQGFYLYNDEAYKHGETYYIELVVLHGLDLSTGVVTAEFRVQRKPPSKPKLTVSAGRLGAHLSISRGSPDDEIVQYEFLKKVGKGWIVIGRGTASSMEDNTSCPKGTHYKARVYTKEGAYAESNVEKYALSVFYPQMLNMRTGLGMRIWDIIKTDTTERPLKKFHRVAGRAGDLVETGLYSNKTLNLTWILDDLSLLHKYEEFLTYDDTFLYRDKEGRCMFVTLTDITVNEEYNPIRWTMSIVGEQVEYSNEIIEVGSSVKKDIVDTDMMYVHERRLLDE